MRLAPMPLPRFTDINTKAARVSGGGLLSASTAQPIASTSTHDDSTPEPQGRRASSIDSDAIDDDDFEVGRPASKKRKVVASGKSAVAVGGGTKAPRAKGKGKGKQPEFVTTLPWPQHFVELEKTFKVSPSRRNPAARRSSSRAFQALNTVYTFFSVRKSMATTYETLKGAVENILRRCALLS